MKRAYEIFADCRQFDLWDAERPPSTALDYTEREIARRIKVAPHLVVILPERSMTVPVGLEIGDGAPALDLDAWNHVAEASLDLPSGRLEIHECTGGSVAIVRLTPGCYRLRALYAGLGTLSADWLEGDDRCHLVLWPAPAAALSILKQHEGRPGDP